MVIFTLRIRKGRWERNILLPLRLPLPDDCQHCFASSLAQTMSHTCQMWQEICDWRSSQISENILWRDSMGPVESLNFSKTVCADSLSGSKCLLCQDLSFHSSFPCGAFTSFLFLGLFFGPFIWLSNHPIRALTSGGECKERNPEEGPPAPLPVIDIIRKDLWSTDLCLISPGV